NWRAYFLGNLKFYHARVTPASQTLKATGKRPPCLLQPYRPSRKQRSASAVIMGVHLKKLLKKDRYQE
ncbi:MAG: hypothetical protein KGQ57_12725, partial [Burkholderiales bacterium]|nr:hypothetical protein [Burkholderiales bacterium]